MKSGAAYHERELRGSVLSDYEPNWLSNYFLEERYVSQDVHWRESVGRFIVIHWNRFGTRELSWQLWIPTSVSSSSLPSADLCNTGLSARSSVQAAGVRIFTNLPRRQCEHRHRRRRLSKRHWIWFWVWLWIWFWIRARNQRWTPILGGIPAFRCLK